MDTSTSADCSRLPLAVGIKGYRRRALPQLSRLEASVSFVDIKSVTISLVDVSVTLFRTTKVPPLPDSTPICWNKAS